MPAARREGDDLLLELRVQPRASRTEFAGRLGDRLKLRLQAPPVDGRANEALVGFLAATFCVSRAAVTIERGLAGRDKTVRVRGVGRLAPHNAALVGLD